MKLPEKTYKKKYAIQHGRCFYCGIPLDETPVEVDHIIARALKGDGTRANLCLACVSCNRLKCDMSVPEFKALITVMRPDKLIRGMLYCEFINIYQDGKTVY